MVLSLAMLLLQVPQASAAAPRAAQPVRVWLGSSGVLSRGTPVRVYVQAAQDGNLIVLHRRTDGRIDVLFPAKPDEDPFVRAGTYEIQATPSRVAFVVAEPDGSGLVLAALAPRAYRFDEFARAATWDPDALAPSWDGSDGEGVLSDIVQRMLGDGYFNYDIATYTVAPPVYAMQQDTGVQYPLYPTCSACTFIGFQQNLFEPLALCDPFFSPCIGDGRFHQRGRRPQEAPAAPSRTLALSMRGSSATPVIPRDGRAAGGTGFVHKPIEPRARAPLLLPRGRASLPIRAVPLGSSAPECAGRARVRSGGEPDAHTHPLAGRACRSAQEQRFARPDWPERVTTRPTRPVLAHARVAAGNACRAGDRTHDRPGTGTGGGWKHVEGKRGSRCAGDDGSNPGNRAATGDVPRSPGARARRAYRRAAALTDATSYDVLIVRRSVVPS